MVYQSLESLRMFRKIAVVLLLACSTLLPALDKQPVADYRTRREAIGKALNGGVAILFAAQEPVLDFMPYRQDENFYYLTGWNEPGAALLIQSEAAAAAAHPARAYREILFLPTRNLRTEQFTGVKLDAKSPNAVADSGVAEVQDMTELPSVLNKLASQDGRIRQNLYTQHDSPEARALLTWLAATLGVEDVPDAHDVADPLIPLRTVKDAREIALLTKATDASIVAQ